MISRNQLVKTILKRSCVCNVLSFQTMAGEVMKAGPIVPEYFEDDSIKDALKASYMSEKSRNDGCDTYWPFNKSDDKTIMVDESKRRRFPLLCGLVIKLRTGMIRIVKRSKMRDISPPHDTYEDRLYRLVRYHLEVTVKEEFLQQWTKESLFLAATELAEKAVYLSSPLYDTLCEHPLLPLNPITGRLEFHEDFLRKVAEYHKTVQRPLGTYSLDGCTNSDVRVRDDVGKRDLPSTGGDESLNAVMSPTDDGLSPETAAKIKELAEVAREQCPKCLGRRQLYCGDCGGIRMPIADTHLPPRIALPFDVLLVIHWQEEMHKCTGVQTATLSEEGAVQCAYWPKAKLKKELWDNSNDNNNNSNNSSGNNGCNDRAQGADTTEKGADSGTVVSTGYRGRRRRRKDWIIRGVSTSEQNKTLKTEEAESDSETQTPSIIQGIDADAAANITTSSSAAVGSSGTAVGTANGTASSSGKSSNSNSNANRSRDYGINNILNLEETWGSMVASLDPNRDVVLFPSEDAILADQFPWDQCNYRDQREVTADNSNLYTEGGSNKNTNTSGATATATATATEPYYEADGVSNNGVSNGGSAVRAKWRLVVLEASWHHGLTMYNQLTAYRKLRGLPPLKTVSLADVTGEYWRFHEEGNAAVSTIEAIAHTAKAAGLAPQKIEELLVLFRLQKFRVLSRIKRGGKAPKAVAVSGEGLGSWEHLTSQLK